MEAKPEEEKEIRCAGCGNLLAIMSNGVIRIKFRKEVCLILAGTIWLECGNCEELIRIDG